MMKQSFSQPLTQLSSVRSSSNSPIKQQWAIINQYKALQYERLKQKQRQLEQQKKYKFKNELDDQLISKSNQYSQEQQTDRKYYEFVVRQANAQKEKEERQKLQKMVKRRQCEEQNAHLLQQTRNSRLSKQQRQDSFNFQIGTRSQIEHKMKSEYMKRAVMDTLDEQLKIKQKQRLRQKYQQQQQYNQNLQYQQAYEHKRTSNKKNFAQNQKVYEFYKELERQKKAQEFQLQHKLVDQAAKKQRHQQDQRIRNQRYKKLMAKDDMKETLDRQVMQHNIHKLEQQAANPEDYSYGVIGNIFRERKQTYDKQQYMQELKAQVQIQRQKKKNQNYMSDEEYRLNMNQLNKVVNGEYTFSNYLDRSLGTIGDNRQFRLADIKDSIADGDSDQIREKLENLRKRNQSRSVVRNDRSAFF